MTWRAAAICTSLTGAAFAAGLIAGGIWTVLNHHRTARSCS